MSNSVLMKLFRDISAVPRASFQEEKISNFVADFGRTLGLETIQDEFYNVLIRKPASTGYEAAPVVMLQAHIDMVAEKNKDSDHDFENDGLELIVEDGILRANETTLGADDGVGVVYMMALLQDKNAKHPALECVFTVEEEVGLIGATDFDTSDLKAQLCVGLDSSGEKEVYVSSSGGVRGFLQSNVSFVENDYTTVSIAIRGLLGGHSGGEIDQERASALKLAGIIMQRALDEFKTVQLVNLDGGLKVNAITREADLELAVDDVASFATWFKEIEAEFLIQYATSDAGLKFILKNQTAKKALTIEDTKRVAALLFMLPYGVIQKSKDIEGLVITSANIGTATLINDSVELNVSLRATQGFVIENVMRQVAWLADTLSFNCEYSSRYPGWNYEKDSPFRLQLKKVYHELRNEEMMEVATHGGVELGIWKGKMPHLDIISLGPIMYDIHTPNERLDIGSFERTYDVLAALLASLNEVAL